MWPKSPEEFIANSKAYLEQIEINWEKIPLLNYTPLMMLEQMALVRFRGIIQDMFTPEIYMKQCKIVSKQNEEFLRLQNCKYHEKIVIEDATEKILVLPDSENLSGRRAFHLISRPYLNSWAETIESESNSIVCDMENYNGEPPKKRALLTSPKESYTKFLESLLKEYYNCDIEEPQKNCIVKLYENYDGYVLHTPIEVVGFVSFGTKPVQIKGSITAETTNNFAKNPPLYYIPRIHVIKVEKLCQNPLLDRRLSMAKNYMNETIHMELLYNESIELLKLLLFNDGIAAHYLLSYMISRIREPRREQLVGKFCLNLCDMPGQYELPGYTDTFYKILSKIFVASVYVKMQLNTLQTTDFAPTKSYDIDKLQNSLLQLAPHTHLVLDETYMEEGCMKDKGVKNMQILWWLVKNQELLNDFTYYQLPCPVDIPVLTLSVKKNMFVHDYTMPVMKQSRDPTIMAESLKNADRYLDEKRLCRIRRYLTLARNSDFILSDPDCAIVEKDFVEMRQGNIISSGEELHKMLNLLRIISAARGRRNFDPVLWDMAKSYELERAKRLRVHEFRVSTSIEN